MTVGIRKVVAAVMCCLPALGQTTYKATKSVGTVTYSGQAQSGAGASENAYCPAGVGELTEGIPTWGMADGPAQLPTRCMNTAVSSTPSGTHIGGGAATTYTPADASALKSALGTLQCGDTIVLAAGNTYTGSFTFPALACNGGHWITVKSSGVNASAFPAEGVRATPCLSGIPNDAANGRNNPGYPDYPCPTYPAVFTARIAVASGSPAVAFASGANHYRFVGIEITKVPDTKVDTGLVTLAPDGVTLGANHIIFDRCIIHGQPWTLASTTNAETQGGIRAKNSQWVALISSWNYDTYCNSACVDSHGFSTGTGAFQDGPFKLYNNLIASSGENYMGGGGGQGASGTPNTKDVEYRGNYLLKPLIWMVPIEGCSLYSDVIPKNLGEFKSMTYALIEGNYYENSWQGCQSDQSGYALLLGGVNQNNHQAMKVNFDGTNVVVAADSNSFTHDNGTRDDGANCPPGGCILEIADTARAGVDDNADYRFCNGANGCDQSGMDLVTHARLTTTVAAGSSVNVNACVPGDCPTCRAENITYRYNEIYNATNGFAITNGKSSHCADESAGTGHITIRDNLIHGLSAEMSNGSTAYAKSVGMLISSAIEGAVINSVEFAHNTVGVETGNTDDISGLGSEVDRTDHKWLQGFKIHDNVSPAPWIIGHSNGAPVGPGGGVGGNGGLANTYQTNSCHPYYPNEAPGGSVVAGNLSSFTFSPALSSYMVTVGGKYADLATSPAPTSTSFTLKNAADAGDPITVRDLADCDWTFRGNLLGTSLPGSGQPNDPYPSSNNTNCGTSGTAACILDGAAFASLFANWGTGRTGNFALTSATYLNSASDAITRAATGKSPGADLTVIIALTAAGHGSVYFPALSVTSSSLPAATVGTAYQASLQASAGASPFKAWWIETDATQCGGNCGTFPASAGIIVGRGGTVNGPLIVQLISRAANVTTFNLQQTLAGGAPLTGQTVRFSGFINGTGSQANDASFNGTCVIQTVANQNISCPQTGPDVTNHAPKNTSVASFAPTGTGSFTFWVGARDGAFQKARGQVTLTIASESGHFVDLNWNASASDGHGGCCTYRVYRSTSSGNYGADPVAEVSGTTFADTTAMSGTTYYYVVTAFNGPEESAHSNETVAVVP